MQRIRSLLLIGLVTALAACLPEEEENASPSVPSGDAGDPASGPHPIVLAHGMFGQESYLGILDYWSTVPDVLRAAGHVVYVTEVDPLNSPVVRGERLIEQLEALAEANGHAKFILVGHSQGGLEIRYVASTRPDLVEAVLSVASPHYGTPAVDIARALLEDGATIEAVVNFVVKTFFPLVWDEIGDTTSLYTSLLSMTAEATEEFAEAFPDAPGVAYYSITGVTDRVPMSHPHCAPDLVAPPVARWASERDPAILPLSIGEALLDDDDLLDVVRNTYPNDGLVRAIDTRWGSFLGCLPADHAEIIGLTSAILPGYHPGCHGLCLGTNDTALCDCNDFDYELFWVEMLEWLRERGH